MYPNNSSANVSLYIAPKAILGQQKAEYAAPSVEKINNLPLIEHVNAGYWFPGKYLGKPLNTNESQSFGAVAVGVDLFRNLRLPLRIEVELSTNADNKVKGEGVRHWHGANNLSVFIEARAMSYTTNTAFVNMFVDWHNGTSFTPYFGGGLGLVKILARADIDAWFEDQLSDGTINFGSAYDLKPIGFYEFKKESTQLAWHLDLGLAYAITDKVSVDLSYRYLDLGPSLKIRENKDQKRLSYTVTRQVYTYNVDYTRIVTGPEELIFEPTHQVVLGFRYTFL